MKTGDPWIIESQGYPGLQPYRTKTDGQQGQPWLLSTPLPVDGVAGSAGSGPWSEPRPLPILPFLTPEMGLQDQRGSPGTGLGWWLQRPGTVTQDCPQGSRPARAAVDQSYSPVLFPWETVPAGLPLPTTEKQFDRFEAYPECLFLCLSQRKAAHPVDQQFAEPSCGFILQREVQFPPMDGAHPDLVSSLKRLWPPQNAAQQAHT